MEIKKINNQEKVELEVRGQGCNNDCKQWLTSKEGVTGCTCIVSAVITGLFEGYQRRQCFIHCLPCLMWISEYF